jgi:hypothetical protein
VETFMPIVETFMDVLLLFILMSEFANSLIKWFIFWILQALHALILRTCSSCPALLISVSICSLKKEVNYCIKLFGWANPMALFISCCSRIVSGFLLLAAALITDFASSTAFKCFEENS